VLRASSPKVAVGTKPALLAATLLFLLTPACVEEDRHARVVVELAPEVAVPVTTLQVSASLATAEGDPLRDQEGTLPEDDASGALSFPADFVVLLGDAHGELAVSVTGLGAEQAPVAAGVASATIAAGGTGRLATLRVVLAVAAGSLGCGDGTVATGELCYAPAMAPTTLPAGGVAAADLDGDGLADIVAAIGGEDPGRGLSLTRSRGGDEFDPPVTHFGPAVPNAGAAGVALGDVNGDGLVDAVVSSAGGQPPLLTLGRAEEPRFGVLSPIRDPGPDPVGLSPVLADLDADGDLDLCTMSLQELWIGLGEGDGTFTPVGIATIPAANDLAVGNVDDDPQLEVITTEARDEILRVFDPDLEPVATLPIPDLRVVGVAEIDGTAPAEILAGVGTTIQVLHVEGGTLVTDGVTEIAPGRTMKIAPMAFDEGRQGAFVLVDEQRDEGGYLPQVVDLVPAGGRALEERSRGRIYCWNGTMAVADLEGDGIDEALVTCEGGGVAIVRADAPGGEILQPMRGVSTWYVTVGDIDGDAQPDALLVPWELDLVRRADEPNAGDFPERLPDSPGGNIDPVFADFTGDARDDLASICDELSWCEQGALKRWTASAGGAISALPPVQLPAEPEVLAVAYTVPGERVRLVVGMLDGGLVVVNGDSGVTEATATGVPVPAFALAAGPLDAEPGDDAVAIGEGDDGSIALFRGDGAGGFSDGEPSGATPGPSALVVADLDGDGLAEVVIAQRDAAHVQVLRLAAAGLEDAGSFETTQNVHVGSAYDLDGDAIPELLLASDGRVEMWNLRDGAAVLRKTLVGFGGYANAPSAWPRSAPEGDPIAPLLFVAGQPDLGPEGWVSYVMMWRPQP